MLDLKNITIVSINTRDPELSVKAIERSCKYINFGTVLLLSDKKIKHKYIKTKLIPTINSLEEYSLFCVKELYKYVDTDYCLLVQPDGFVTNPFMWSDEFLKYDYVAAPWDKLLSERGLWMCGMLYAEFIDIPIIVGNGGFSLRSVKLLEAIKRPGFIKRHPEDYCICVDNKEFLEQECGIRIAPVNVAEQFAVERSPWHQAFGFHGFFNFGMVLNDESLRAFISSLPENYLRGLDAYDLVSYLRQEGRLGIAKEIAQKVRFKWKMRKRYIKLKFWLLSA